MQIVVTFLYPIGRKCIMLKWKEKEYSFENFVVGKANENVYQTTRIFVSSDCEFDLLFIVGNVGSGKTHLTKTVEYELKSQNILVKIQNSEQFVSELIAYLVNNSNRSEIESFCKLYDDCEVFILDDIHFLDEKESIQQYFAHILECLVKKHKKVMITSVKDLSKYKWLYDVLNKNKIQAVQIQIHDADEELKNRILENLQKEWCYELSKKSINLILNRARNIRELEGLFKRLVAYHQFMGIEGSEEILN